MNDIDEVKNWVIREITRLKECSIRNKSPIVGSQLFGAQAVLCDLFNKLSPSKSEIAYQPPRRVYLDGKYQDLDSTM